MASNFCIYNDDFNTFTPTKNNIQDNPNHAEEVRGSTESINMADYIKTDVVEEEPIENDYVYSIEAPIVEDLFEPDVEDIQTRGYNTTWQERTVLKETAIKEGFEKRAVVVLRNINTFFRDEPCHWGIVLDVIAYNFGLDKYYAPIEVKWLTGNTSYHYPDELIVCMYAPDDQDIMLIRRGEN